MTKSNILQLENEYIQFVKDKSLDVVFSYMQNGQIMKLIVSLLN